MTEEAVEVGGVKVDQGKLKRMFFWLASHGSKFVPEGHMPDMGRFAPPSDPNLITEPEEYVYLILSDPSVAPRGFRQTFISPDGRERHRSAAAFLKEAGFPATTVAAANSRAYTKSERVKEWASEYHGPLSPWLWVSGGSESLRALVLAMAAFGAAESADVLGIEPPTVMYAHAQELCHRVNSADMYGPNSKWNAIQGVMTCGILALVEMGTEHVAPRELDTIHQVLTARSREGHATLIASERGLATWKAERERVSDTQARDVCEAVTSGLCAYMDWQTDHEAATKAIRSHVIDLDRD